MNNRQKDAAIERLLGDAMRRDARAGGPCLDAETVAMLADGTLAGSPRAAAEAHAASCLRCQSVLAAMARSGAAPGGSMADANRGLVRGVRWLVPLAGAAAAAALVLAIWPGAPTSVPLPEAAVRSEASKEAPSAREAESNRAVQPQQKEEFAAAGDPRQSEQKTAEPTAPRDSVARSDAAGGGARESLEGQRAESRPAPARVSEAPAASPAPPPPPAAPLPPQQLPQTPQSLPGQQQQLPQQLPQQQTQAPVGQQAASPSQGRLSKPASGAAAEAVPTVVERSSALAFRDAGSVVIPTPAASTKFRILNGREIQRSEDGGTTWSRQTEVGSDRPLLAGNCPTTTACWMVGVSGAVLRTTDGGRSWTAVPFNEPVDLIGVQATDALNAVVTARDGRTFTTRDGGHRWSGGQISIF